MDCTAVMISDFLSKICMRSFMTIDYSFGFSAEKGKICLWSKCASFPVQTLLERLSRLLRNIDIYRPRVDLGESSAFFLGKGSLS